MGTIMREGLDPRELRDAYGCFPSGVAAVCAMTGDGPVGMAVSSFTCVSLSPALVSICLQNGSATWDVLRTAPRLGVSVLAEHQGGVCRQLSRGTRAERLRGLDRETSPAGAVFVREAVAWFDCSVHGLLHGGDHTIALLRVHAFTALPKRPPLVFHGGVFRHLSP